MGGEPVLGMQDRSQRGCMESSSSTLGTALLEAHTALP